MSSTAREHYLTAAPAKEKIKLEISCDDFENLSNAAKRVPLMLAIADKMQLVGRNYEEFEQTLLSVALRQTIRPSTEWGDYWDDAQLVNRRLLNLFAAMRMYTDQTNKGLIKLYGRKSKELVVLQDALATAKSVLGYRFLWNLRNYSQHHALPVSSVAIKYSPRNETRAPRTNSQVLEHAFVVKLDIRDLAEDRQFDKATLEEVSAAGDLVDVRPLVREGVAALGDVHGQIWGSLVSDFQTLRDRLINAKTLFEQAGGDTRIGFSAIRTSDRQRPVRLPMKMLNRIEQITLDNERLRHLDRLVVSNALDT